MLGCFLSLECKPKLLKAFKKKKIVESKRLRKGHGDTFTREKKKKRFPSFAFLLTLIAEIFIFTRHFIFLMSQIKYD